MHASILIYQFFPFRVITALSDLILSLHHSTTSSTSSDRFLFIRTIPNSVVCNLSNNFLIIHLLHSCTCILTSSKSNIFFTLDLILFIYQSSHHRKYNADFSFPLINNEMLSFRYSGRYKNQYSYTSVIQLQYRLIASQVHSSS